MLNLPGAVSGPTVEVRGQRSEESASHHLLFTERATAWKYACPGQNNVGVSSQLTTTYPLRAVHSDGLGHFSVFRGAKPNFLFRASFDVKLTPSGVFSDALNGSAIGFYLAAQFGVKF